MGPAGLAGILMDTPRASCLFVSDLHGSRERYAKLVAAIEREAPAAVFLGGDLLPAFGLGVEGETGDFVVDELVPAFSGIRDRMGARAYPRVFVILGNDDPRTTEGSILEGVEAGLWEYVHDRKSALGEHAVYGYSFVPPSPFGLKDWERYDVSRYVDPGCVSPEEGWRSVDVPANESRYSTIREDLERLAGRDDLSRAVFLFHAPPYGTGLDRAAVDGRRVEHVPVDVHVGSIAIRRFIESRRPLLTLHGHVHESARLTGVWKERIGSTVALSAAHDGPELAVVVFDPHTPDQARRDLL